MLLIAHLPLMGGVTPLPALSDDRLASLPASSPSLTHALLSPQQHHSHRVAMETAERHTSRVRDGERKRDNEGQRERERERGET